MNIGMQLQLTYSAQDSPLEGCPRIAAVARDSLVESKLLIVRGEYWAYLTRRIDDFNLPRLILSRLSILGQPPSVLLSLAEITRDNLLNLRMIPLLTPLWRQLC